MKASGLREYLAANLFDGDDSRPFLDEIVDSVIQYLIDGDERVEERLLDFYGASATSHTEDAS